MQCIGSKRVIVFILFVETALFSTGCSGCDKQDDEAQIRELIEKGAILAEQHNVKELMQFTTKDFIAMPQSLDRRSAKGMLLMAFRRYKKFKVRFPRPTVNIDASSAYAEATTQFAIVREGGTVPDLSGLYEDPESWLIELGELADIYKLGLWLIKQDDRWLIRKARLETYQR